MPESSSIPGPGSRLGQYEIVRTAGVGGMGVVYLAHDPDLERDVAIKLLKAPKDSAAAPDAEAAERFLREARSAARLNHPNTVAVYQVGRHEGLVFIAMEWVDGGSMAEHLRHHLFLDWREATAAVRDAAAGLAAAHRAGIVHRDLKPANLMRTRGGVVKVTDFGLARVLDAKSELTHAGTILGTPAYLSPEQCRGEPATIASDVYALGCAFFTLLTSRPPYDAPNLPGMLHCHLNTPFPDARMFADDIPEAVLSIVERSTRKDPASRYPSADVMLADLEAALGDRPIAAALPETIVTPPPDGFEAAVAPGPTAPPPNNLPEPTTSFVGRTRELAEARDLLGRHRLVTLLGPGGTGKTRLSLKLARDVLPLFPGGAWQVELAALTGETADAVPQAIAAALGVRAPAGRPALGAVIEWLGDKACLLILDNCEHLIDASADAAAALLKQCAGARIIATSRQPLGVAGEVELRVPALAAPASGVIGPAELAEVDAVRLFVDRAAQARPGFALVMDNAAAVADICRRLDGIPLAIELAAARVKALAPAQIAARLTDAFGLLTTGPRTVLPRQRTLRALIDWSYDLLAPDERTVLARLSVFAGSWALESAEAVVAGGDVDAGAVMDVLAGLVDKSLVVMDERGGEARYRMLETIRQYAAEKLEASGERGEVEGRHLEHFATFTTEVMPKLWGPEQAQWLARSDLEVDNVRAALDRGLRDPARLSRAADLAAAAYQHWLMRGLVTEGLARLEALIAAGATAGEPTRTRV
ncbi:MAG TPA: protein kinase, partial [Tepidisphaeraceae bacterium]|nr:protein kinase [Tepidisphaeraceae bacterium]